MEEKTNFYLTVLGARGSIPEEGKDFAIYGGSTSCYRVRAGNEEIYLDAGSGIVRAQPEKTTNITILLTHMHLDHLIGLPFFAALSDKERIINIYSCERSGLAPRDAINRLVSLPFWPLKIEDYPANIKYHTLPKIDSDCNILIKPFKIGEVAITTMEGTHPGGSTIFRLTYNGKSIVYATDFEHIPTFGCEALINFSKGCDLLLYDAQYNNDEYDKFCGYGHSTPESGLKIAKFANAKKVMFIHHAPWRKDNEIKEMEKAIQEEHENVIFAKIGDKIFL